MSFVNPFLFLRFGELIVFQQAYFYVFLFLMQFKQEFLPQLIWIPISSEILINTGINQFGIHLLSLCIDRHF
jgi:hypothetical protein